MSENELYAMVFSITAVIVIPCLLLFGWLMMRERNRRPASGAMDAHLAQLAETARRLESRVDYLEAMLDAEVPGWRRAQRSGGMP